MDNVTIRVEIDNQLSRRFPFDFEKNIRSLLNFIPKEHLIQLGEIKIIESSPEKKQKTAYGFYYGKAQGIKNPTVIICISNLFNKMPKIIFYIAPFIPKILLADTLYHEIGHHFQSFTHGLKKEQWETNANSYARNMIKKAFKENKWFLFILFGPILILRKLLKKNKINK